MEFIYKSILFVEDFFYLIKILLIDLFIKFSQAFSSQFTYGSQKSELDPEKVNVNGGAISLGHPLGARSEYFH